MQHTTHTAQHAQHTQHTQRVLPISPPSLSSPLHVTVTNVEGEGGDLGDVVRLPRPKYDGGLYVPPHMEVSIYQQKTI